MSDEPAGKDGVYRVIARMKQERKVIRRSQEEHWIRFKAAPDSHSLVNLPVEYERVPGAAYYRGHMLFYYFVLNLISTGMLIAYSVN